MRAGSNGRFILKSRPKGRDPFRLIDFKANDKVQADNACQTIGIPPYGREKALFLHTQLRQHERVVKRDFLEPVVPS